jgi:hypothetical protein
MIDEFDGKLSMYTPWLQNIETAYMNHGTESDNNTNNLYPIPYSRYESTLLVAEDRNLESAYLW